jgi:hypothetical protein
MKVPGHASGEALSYHGRLFQSAIAPRSVNKRAEARAEEGFVSGGPGVAAIGDVEGFGSELERQPFPVLPLVGYLEIPFAEKQRR